MSLVQLDFAYGIDNNGSEGWIPKIQPEFDAMSGLGVAHDSMEHFNIAAGTLEEEFLAFGSMLYIRVESGWFYSNGNYGTPARNMASDLARFIYERWLNDGEGLKPVKGRPRHLDETLEHDLHEIAVETKRLIGSEFEYDPEESYAEFKAANVYLSDRIKQWIRQGYWRAKRRYRDASVYDLADCFTQIRDKVEKLTKYAQEGEELQIRVKVSRGRAIPTINHRTLEEMWPEEAY